MHKPTKQPNYIFISSHPCLNTGATIISHPHTSYWEHKFIKAYEHQNMAMGIIFLFLISSYSSCIHSSLTHVNMICKPVVLDEKKLRYCIAGSVYSSWSMNLFRDTNHLSLLLKIQA